MWQSGRGGIVAGFVIVVCHAWIPFDPFEGVKHIQSGLFIVVFEPLCELAVNRL